MFVNLTSPAVSMRFHLAYLAAEAGCLRHRRSPRALAGSSRGSSECLQVIYRGLASTIFEGALASGRSSVKAPGPLNLDTQVEKNSNLRVAIKAIASSSVLPVPTSEILKGASFL